MSQMLMLVETSLEDGGQEKSDAVKTKRTCVHHGATIMMMNKCLVSSLLEIGSC